MYVALLIGAILIIAVLSCKATDKIGIPVLVGFLFIGMLIGRRFGFDSNDDVVHICNLALIIIIFTGGLQTNFAEVKPVLKVSTILATLGTAATAIVCGLFGHYVMGLELAEAFLLGAVISSTDAASVFSIFASKNIRLKNGLGAIMQFESGSNDPIAYMLSIVLLSMVTGGSQSMASLLFVQIAVGMIVGVVMAKLGQFFVNRINLDIDGLCVIMLLGISFVTYSVSGLMGGNSFLAIFIAGILLGNGKLIYKKFLARIFGIISTLMQIVLFIVLGMLCVPKELMSPEIIGSSLLFAAFLFFVARPAVVFAFMKPFGHSLKEVALVSCAGFRGASSIVFTTYLLAAGLPYAGFVFNVVFFVCLLSIIFLGAVLVPFAERLDLAENEEKKPKSFADYEPELHDEVLQATVRAGGFACGKTIEELNMPEDIFIVMIKRCGKYIAPIPTAKLVENDTVLIAGSDEELLKKLRGVICG